MKVGLYFGSFNPIHNGHLQVAEYMLQHIPVNEVWFIPSPLNPHKLGDVLIPANLRLKWVKMATENLPNIQVNDIEFGLGLPSFTHRTVEELYRKHPDYQFSLIMGADNLPKFHSWQNAESLAVKCPLHVYARPGYEVAPNPMPFNAQWHQAPLIDISATEIRECIQYNQPIKQWVPECIIPELLGFFHPTMIDFHQ